MYIIFIADCSLFEIVYYINFYTLTDIKTLIIYIFLYYIDNLYVFIIY